MIQTAQKGNLRLQVTYTPDGGATSGRQAPAFVSEIQRLLSRSGLKNSQWRIAANAPAESEPKAAEALRLRQPRPEEKVLRRLLPCYFAAS